MKRAFEKIDLAWYPLADLLFRCTRTDWSETEWKSFEGFCTNDLEMHMEYASNEPRRPSAGQRVA
jgi:hypothetical protein